MAKPKTRLRTTMNWLATGLLLLALLIVFVTSPFYARAILWGLNQIPVSVNQVAAASQKGVGALDALPYEPGSPEWLQQQAASTPGTAVPGATPSPPAILGNQSAAELIPPHTLDKLYSAEQLARHKSDIVTLEQLRYGYRQAFDLAAAPLQSQPRITNKNNAHVIVVVGGGLAKDQHQRIFVNRYTQLRLQKAIEQKTNNPVPILLSGVEAPYMQDWLTQHGVAAGLLENKSMNTCENSRFSSLLLQKKGGAPRVELITDAYHMPRTRRLFAINGIDTIPVIAPLPNALTQWQPHRNNLMHSRRATYEAIASLRDLWFGEINCREVP